MLKKELISFLHKHSYKERPLLIAMSGGADSTALFYALLQIRERMDLDLHVAHVDHGWRKESSQERELLQKLADSYQVVFHSTVISYDKKVRNLEEYCRLERLKFFQGLWQKYSYEGVLLAHQKNDLAETLLKQFLEGAELYHLGMKAVTDYEGMPLWRPLLGVSRKEIIKWLQKENLSFFKDSSNEDLKFFRVRMRKNILPFLEKECNKNLLDNLYNASIKSEKLKVYLDNKLKIYMDKTSIGPFGLMIDFSNETLASYERQYLVKSLLKKKGVVLSRSLLNNICLWIENGASNKKAQMQAKKIIVDRKRLFVLAQDLSSIPASLSLKEGIYRFGSWKVQIKKESTPINRGNWKDLWKGRAVFSVPQGCSLSLSSGLQVADNKRFNKFISNQKIPVFLKELCPVVMKDKSLIGELLSGKEWKMKDLPSFFRVIFEHDLIKSPETE